MVHGVCGELTDYAPKRAEEALKSVEDNAQPLHLLTEEGTVQEHSRNQNLVIVIRV